MKDKTYILKHPLKIDNKDITELTLSPIKVGDLIDIEEEADENTGQNKLNSLMLSKITDKDMAIIRELSIDDFRGILEEAADFLPQATVSSEEI